jgi:uncharacterized iron-regulated protein
MNKILVALLAIVLFAAGCPHNVTSNSPRIFDLNRQKEITLAQALTDLKQRRILLVGEYHTDKNHHLGQLQVIRMLHQSGARVAIGLEMFRKDSQGDLDRWVSGDMPEKEFLKVYYDNWNFAWPFYSMIFEYARDHQIKMLGLNVPRDITRQVASQGFSSLNQNQKGKLSNITCRVDKEYMQYIRRSFGAHAHGNLNFTYFCEAQLVWDTVMAINALDYVNSNPDTIVVILAGTGHARKPAIPEQIRKRSKWPYAVILPEIPGRIDPNTISSKEADYIFLNRIDS